VLPDHLEAALGRVLRETTLAPGPSADRVRVFGASTGQETYVRGRSLLSGSVEWGAQDSVNNETNQYAKFVVGADGAHITHPVPAREVAVPERPPAGVLGVDPGLSQIAAAALVCPAAEDRTLAQGLLLTDPAASAVTTLRHSEERRRAARRRSDPLGLGVAPQNRRAAAAGARKVGHICRGTITVAQAAGAQVALGDWRVEKTGGGSRAFNRRAMAALVSAAI
jgi:hypothetical protein